MKLNRERLVNHPYFPLLVLMIGVALSFTGALVMHTYIYVGMAFHLLAGGIMTLSITAIKLQEISGFLDEVLDANESMAKDFFELVHEMKRISPDSVDIKIRSTNENKTNLN